MDNKLFIIAGFTFLILMVYLSHRTPNRINKIPENAKNVLNNEKKKKTIIEINSGDYNIESFSNHPNFLRMDKWYNEIRLTVGKSSVVHGISAILSTLPKESTIIDIGANLVIYY